MNAPLDWSVIPQALPFLAQGMLLSLGLLAASLLGGLAPVSYTHLDVYKRQAIARDVEREPEMPTLQVKLVPVTSQTRIPLLINNTIDSVSYTHLHWTVCAAPDLNWWCTPATAVRPVISTACVASCSSKNCTCLLYTSRCV